MENTELINDSRLTPTIEISRSGSTQMFRESDENDRTFINKGNCDFVLKHENKEMYAKLINEKWYWVSGCCECNGEKRDKWKSYIECDKHDVCESCFINRKEIEGSVWGGSNGWTCKPCYEEKKSKELRDAFEKLNGEKPDCDYTDEIICPHCGSEISNEEIYESQDIQCDVCYGEIELLVEWTASYTTTVKGERITG